MIDKLPYALTKGVVATREVVSKDIIRTPFDIEEDADFSTFGIDEELDGYE